MLPNIDVNLGLVLWAGAAAMILGALWYSPLLFGNAWMEASGVTKQDIEKSKKKGMGKLYLVAFIATLVTSYVLAFLIKLANVTNVYDGVKIGLLLWLGMAVPIILGSVLWEGKAKGYFFINVFHYLVSVVLMSIILTRWG